MINVYIMCVCVVYIQVTKILYQPYGKCVYYMYICRIYLGEQHPVPAIEDNMLVCVNGGVDSKMKPH